jgi:hypothetical protein
MSQLARLIPTSGPGSGTVTSITFNGGLISTPDPVTTTGTATLDQTNLLVLDGTVYWDTGTQRLNTTATGTAGQVLTSNGVGMPPTYQNTTSGNITITGDSGGPLSGNSFTFTGGSTGLTFAGAGTTETLTGTLVVGNGGTGATTFTSHGVLLGNTTGAITATAAGTTGQVLTGVTGSAPTFQSPAASSITITGDSGGGLTGNSFTFTGGSTGLTFAGAGTTETLGGTLVVSNGGTGRTTLTNHGVLVGAGTGAITQLAVGTTGQVLTGVTGSDPVFAAPAASSITITGDSGGGLTGNSFTFTGGTTGLTFAGAGSTETLGGTLVVSNGGTGRASSTAYAVICGGTTSTAAQQSIASVGTSGQVLTSNGAGALPTFQAAASSSITITGDSGGGLTGTSFTFTGGSTGLTFAGSGTTETLGGTLAIANGGTNATSFTQSNGIVTYNGTRLVNYAGPQINSSGVHTNTAQPAFLVYQSTSPTNVTGDGTTYTLALNTKTFDQATNFNTGTYTFTAPVTGKYYLFCCVSALSTGTTQYAAQINIVTTGNNYYINYVPPGTAFTAENLLITSGGGMFPMTAGDTATFTYTVNGASKTAGIDGGASTTYAGGYLVC